MQTDIRPRQPRARSVLMLGGALVALALGLQGCGDRHPAKAATQTAAKVNHEEITVHQINFLLNRMRASAPSMPASASGLVLDQLVDQTLTLQKAIDQNIDREPAVVDQIEAARRDIISRAYVEKVALGVPKPTPQEIRAYYDAHPALFAQRRIYDLQELDVVAPADRVDALQKVVADSKSMIDIASQVKAMGLHYTGSQATRAAEQLPLARIDEFAELKDGSFLFKRTPQGAEVLGLVASRSQPVALAQAQGAIEQFLQNERKRRLIADDLQALRKAARIQYVGDFAGHVPGAAETTPADATPPPKALPPVLLPTMAAAPPIAVPAPAIAAASMPSSATLDQGLKGMK